MKTKIKYGWLLCLLVFSACNSWIDKISQLLSKL